VSNSTLPATRDAATAARLIASILDRPLAEEDIPDWRQEVSAMAVQSKPPHRTGAHRSLLAFRIGNQWLALPSIRFDCVFDPLSVRRLPHTRHAAIEGMVNLRGLATLKIDLAILLGIQRTAATRRIGLAIKSGLHRTVFDVDAVHGILTASEAQIETSHTSPSFALRLAHDLAAGRIRFQDDFLMLLDDFRLQHTLDHHLS